MQSFIERTTGAFSMAEPHRTAVATLGIIMHIWRSGGYRRM